ncbi:MAG TPA: 4a-hydroxytetrahydrobiopterin dehydratase [Gammaproteobacteria bacterium]|nr:4a-hydroxytetrahydrobiopterin dehydratase [Gammaproteobacteria bacterium]
MTELAEKHCVPCEGGIQPLTRDEAERYLKKIAPDWTLTADAKELRRDFKFKGFNGTMGFVNALAWIANRENHHPDLEVGYNHCLVRYSTHAIGGLSENDFICAAKVDALLAK